MKCLKLCVLLLSSCLLLLLFCPIVSAGSYPEMTDEIAEDIIDHFKISTYNSYYGSSGYSEVSQSQIIEYLNSIDIDEFCYFFNNAFDSVSGDNISWNNISVVFLNGRYDYEKQFWFFITKGNTNLNVGEIKIHNYQNSWNEIRPYNNDSVFVARYSLSNNQSLSSFSFKLLTNSNGPKINPLQTNFTISGDVIDVPFIYALSDNQYVYWNNTKYYLQNYKEESIEIKNSTNSEFGYYWFNSNKSIRVNKFNGNNTTLDILWYKGNRLTHTYNFYYFNESGDKILINNYIREYNPSSNLTGKNYMYVLLRDESNYYNNLPDNTNFYLDLQIINGNQDITIVQNWLAFKTYTDRLGNYTGTITNQSGEISTISGDINIYGLNEDYWGNSDDIASDFFESQISGDVIGAISTLSGDLSNSEIFGALESAEQGFINILQERPR